MVWTHHLQLSLTSPPQCLPLPQPPLSHSGEWLTVHASFAAKTKDGSISDTKSYLFVQLDLLILQFIGTRTLREQTTLSSQRISRTLPFPFLIPPSAAKEAGRRWFHLSLLCVCVPVKEVEAVCLGSGWWVDLWIASQLKDLQNMEGKKVLHFVPSGKFHRVTAESEKILHGATWAKCVNTWKKLPTVCSEFVSVCRCV